MVTSISVGLRMSVLTIKELDHQHVCDYLQMFSQPVQEILHVRSVASEQQYLLTHLADPGDSVFYMVMLDDRCIGALAIRDKKRFPGQLYSWLHHDFWGKGYCQQALALALDRYFEKTGESYCTAHVDCTNLRSYKALKKAGFADLAIIRGPYGKQFELVFRKRKNPTI